MKLARQRLMRAKVGCSSVPWYLVGGISKDNCVLAYQPLNAASLASSYVNLAHPGTHDATVVDALPDFTSKVGWTHGANKALDTGYIPLSANHSMIVFSPRVAGTIFAGALSNDKFYMWPNQDGRRYDYGNSMATFPITTPWNYGSMALAGDDCYFNGVLEGTQSPPATWLGTNSYTIWVGGLNPNGLYCNGDISGFALYNIKLNATQVAAIYASFNLIHRDYEWRPNTPTVMDQHGMETLNGKIYIAGGEGGKKLCEYDPSTEVWTTKADLPFAQSNRQSAIFRVVGSKLYFIGGYTNGTGYWSDVYEYDPVANTWDDSRAKMPTAREDMGSAVIGHKIYVFGGIGVGGNTDVLKKVEVYDVDADTWSTLADMPNKKCLGDFGEACNGKIYAVGATNDLTGYPSVYPVTTVYKYDPGTDIWTTVAPVPVSTVYKEVVCVGDNLYVIGGAPGPSQTGSASIYIYNTVSDTWTLSSSVLPNAAVMMGACVLNNKIYVSGGAVNQQGFYKLNVV